MFLFSLNISIDCIQLLLLPLCGVYFSFIALAKRLVQKLFKKLSRICRPDLKQAMQAILLWASSWIYSSEKYNSSQEQGIGVHLKETRRISFIKWMYIIREFSQSVWACVLPWIPLCSVTVKCKTKFVNREMGFFPHFKGRVKTEGLWSCFLFTTLIKCQKSVPRKLLIIPN